MGIKIVTGKVRFNFVSVFEMRKNRNNDEMEYSIQIIIPKKSVATIDKIKSAQAEILKNKFGDKIPKGLYDPLVDCDNDERYSGTAVYSGCYVMSLKNKREKPRVVYADLQDIVDSRELVSGDYGRVSFDMFVFDKAGKKGVTCSLLNVQKLSEGEPLSTISRPEDDFAAQVDSSENDDF